MDPRKELDFFESGTDQSTLRLWRLQRFGFWPIDDTGISDKRQKMPDSESEDEGKLQQSTHRIPPPPGRKPKGVLPFEWTLRHNQNALLTRMLMDTTWHGGEVIAEDDPPLAVSFFTKNPSEKDGTIEKNTFVLNKFLSFEKGPYDCPCVVSADAFLGAIQLPKGNPPPDLNLDRVGEVLEASLDLESESCSTDHDTTLSFQKEPFKNYPKEDLLLASNILHALEGDMRNGEARRLLQCFDMFFQSKLNVTWPRVCSFTTGHRDALFPWVQMFTADDKALFDAPYTCPPLETFVRSSSSSSSSMSRTEDTSSKITTFIPDMVWVGDTPGIVALVVEAEQARAAGRKAEARTVRQMINMMHYQRKVCGLLITSSSASVYLLSKEMTTETCNTKIEHYLKIQRVSFVYRDDKSFKIEELLNFVTFLMKVLWIWNQDPLKVATS